MPPKKLLRSHDQARRNARGQAHAVFETLESRQLLTQFTFNIPQNDGYTSVYLRAGAQDGWVDVFKNSPAGTPVHTFTGDSNNGTGMYIVDALGLANFLFVDQLAAADKPTGTPGTLTDNGIKVQASTVSGGSNFGTLKIEAQPDDELIRVIESTSTSGTVEARDGIYGTDIGNSRFGAGVNKLTIQTHTSGDAIVRVATNENNPIFPPPPPPIFSSLPGLHPNTTLRIESLGPRDRIDLGGAVNASVHAVVHTGAGANEVYLSQSKFVAGSTTTAIVDFDPTLGGGLESGHLLSVGFEGDPTGVNCTATLEQVGTTSHTITIDRVVVTNDTYGIVSGTNTPATLVVADETTIGELVVYKDEFELVGHPLASIEAPLSVVNSTSTSGKAIVNGRMDFVSTSSPSTVHEFAISELLENSPGTVNVNAGASVTAKTNSTIANLNIPSTGTFTLQRRSDSPTVTTSRALTVKSLSMGSSPTGKLDLKDNSLIVDYTGSSPLSTIQSLLTNGYNAAGTRWQGNGIMSALGNAGTHALGYARSTDLFTTFPGSFAGQQVDNTSVLVKYTFYGDATLDGTVNLDDYNILASNFNATGKIWSEGTFNYDANGDVNLDDYNLMASNFNSTGLAFAGGGGGTGGYTYEELLDNLLNGGGPLKPR